MGTQSGSWTVILAVLLLAGSIGCGGGDDGGDVFCCSYCGDGFCGLGENICRCPVDC